MGLVSAKELKNRLGRYLKKVKGGETLVVTERGKPIARIVPLDLAPEAKLKLMEELGLLVPPEGELEAIEPLVTPKQSIAEMLVADRKR